MSEEPSAKRVKLQVGASSSSSSFPEEEKVLDSDRENAKVLDNVDNDADNEGRSVGYNIVKIGAITAHDVPANCEGKVPISRPISQLRIYLMPTSGPPLDSTSDISGVAPTCSTPDSTPTFNAAKSTTSSTASTAAPTTPGNAPIRSHHALTTSPTNVPATGSTMAEPARSTAARTVPNAPATRSSFRNGPATSSASSKVRAPLVISRNMRLSKARREYADRMRTSLQYGRYEAVIDQIDRKIRNQEQEHQKKHHKNAKSARGVSKGTKSAPDGGSTQAVGHGGKSSTQLSRQGGQPESSGKTSPTQQALQIEELQLILTKPDKVTGVSVFSELLSSTVLYLEQEAKKSPAKNGFLNDANKFWQVLEFCQTQLGIKIGDTSKPDDVWVHHDFRKNSPNKGHWFVDLVVGRVLLHGFALLEDLQEAVASAEVSISGTSASSSAGTASGTSSSYNLATEQLFGTEVCDLVNQPLDIGTLPYGYVLRGRMQNELFSLWMALLKAIVSHEPNLISDSASPGQLWQLRIVMNHLRKINVALLNRMNQAMSFQQIGGKQQEDSTAQLRSLLRGEDPESFCDSLPINSPVGNPIQNLSKHRMGDSGLNEGLNINSIRSAASTPASMNSSSGILDRSAQTVSSPTIMENVKGFAREELHGYLQAIHDTLLEIGPALLFPVKDVNYMVRRYILMGSVEKDTPSPGGSVHVWEPSASRMESAPARLGEAQAHVESNDSSFGGKRSKRQPLGHIADDRSIRWRKRYAVRANPRRNSTSSTSAQKFEWLDLPLEIKALVVSYL